MTRSGREESRWIALGRAGADRLTCPQHTGDCGLHYIGGPEYQLILAVPNAVDAFRNALKSHGTEKTSAIIEEYFAFMRQYEAERNRRGKPIDPVQTEIDWRTFNQTMAAFMSSYDVMLCPVHAYPAIKHNTSLEHIQAFSYTMTFNLTGNPAGVVRCGTSPEGLPIGVQIVGPMFREDIVFAVAEYLEKTLGGWQPPPV